MSKIPTLEIAAQSNKSDLPNVNCHVCSYPIRINGSINWIFTPWSVDDETIPDKQFGVCLNCFIIFLERNELGRWIHDE
jgi:hypothetical protein